MYNELMTFLNHMYSISVCILRETDDHRYPLSFELNLFYPIQSDMWTEGLFILSGDLQGILWAAPKASGQALIEIA